MKRSHNLLWTITSLFVVLSLLLAACGGGDEATSTPEPAAPEPTKEAAPAPTKEPVAEFECTDEFGCVTVEQGEKLRIATALVISGPNETLGIDSQRGVEIAIAERGGVMGFDVDLVAEDGQCSAEGGQTAATKITSDETIVAVVGHNCSSSCTPAAPIYQQAGFTMISPSCTAPALTGADTHVEALLRTAHNDKVQGAAAADFAYNVLEARTAATIHDGSPYADQLQQVFADTFVELGGTLTAQEAVNVGDTDMRPLLTSIAVDQPDFLYYPIFIAEGGFISVQAKEIAGLENTILAGADGMQSPDFVEAAGDAGEGMYFSGPDLTATVADRYEKFLTAHTDKYGEDPLSVFHAHAYDAANIIFDAIEAVGVLDGEGNLHIGRKELRDKIYTTSNFPGITGTLTCDDNGDCADPAINVVQLQGGEYVPVWSAKEGVIGEVAEAPAGEFRVGMISDVGGVDDASFNQTTWEGLDRADKTIEGVSAQFLESQAQADYENNITEFAEQGYDMIITVGFLLGDATAKMAEVYPDIKFAIIDVDYLQIPNVQGIGFDTDEAAFMAGYLAAGMAVELDPDDPQIGWVGGMQIPPVEIFIVGYENGMAYYNQQKGASVKAAGSYVGSFDSPSDGKATANSLLDEGVDIIFGVGGPTGNGGLVAVRERAEAGEAVAGIGVDVDQYFTLPNEKGILISSVEKRLDNAVFNTVEAAKNGDFAGGGVYVGTLENDGVGLAPYHDWEDKVPAELKAEVDALKPQVIAGTISTGWPVGAAEEPDMPAEGLASVAAPSCDYGGKIESIVALDEFTVQFNMCKPDPAFLAKAAFTPFGIQPKEWLEETGGTGELLEHPIGTGPYMLDAWNRGESVVFKRFDGYWGEPANAETVVFRWATEGAARLLELQSGNVDQITNVSPDDFETVQNDPDLQLLDLFSPNVLYLAMTNTFEPFDDIRVRQAVAMGIDRQRIVDFFYPEGSLMANYFTPCSIPNGCTGDPWYDFDPEAARALLAEAGYPDGFETSIFYRDVFRGYLPEPSLVAVEFQAQLKENLGIDAEVVVMESGEFIDESTQGRLDGLYLLGWGADYPHVTNFLDFHFSATNPQFGDPHPEIYEVLEEASQIGDAAEAEVLYVQANNAIRELVPMVPIAHGVFANAARADIETHIRPFGAIVAAKVDPGKDTFVFMQNNEPISLYCGDETDGESLAPCEQVVESLLAYELDSGNTIPALATSCEPNADSTVWTCFLREGVKFHDGSDFDATDVVASWAAGIDAANPLHVGNTGAFEYYSYLWDGLMNAGE